MSETKTPPYILAPGYEEPAAQSPLELLASLVPDLNEMPSSGVAPRVGSTPAEQMLAAEALRRIEGQKMGIRPAPVAAAAPVVAPAMSVAAPVATEPLAPEQSMTMERPSEAMMTPETPEAIEGRLAFQRLIEMGIDPTQAADAGRFAKVDELTRKYGAASSYEAQQVQAARTKLAEAEKNFLEVENDPYAFVKDGKNKVMAIVGLIFGAAGSGLTGGKVPNQAMQLFNKFVDMEFKKNVEQKGKLRDLMTVANQRLNNEVTASNMARTALMSGIGKQIDTELRKIGLDQQADMFAQQMESAKLKFQNDALKASMPDRKEQSEIVAKAKETQGSLETINQVETMLREGYTGEEFKNYSKFANRMRNALVYTINNNDNAFANAFLSSISEQYAGAREAFTLLRQMAFEMAAQGQSASSISDKDVNNFLKVLANPGRTDEQIMMALEPFRAKAKNRNAYYQLQIDNPGMSPFEADKRANQMFPADVGQKPLDLTGLEQFITSEP